ncbi:MAG: hypothetical protein E7430_02555 [Ruminococcaceae bacterium]|nr:hypothetical protein [Oscillospiraceae bacterium]
MTKGQVFRSILFVLICVAIFLVVQFYLTCPQDYRNNEWIGGFFEEEPETLDAVYVGSSEVYTFFQPPLAWDKYGIAVHNFTSNSQPFEAAKYIIEECRKTQPDAVYIIDTKQLIKEYKQDKYVINMHYLFDYWPASVTKYKAMVGLLTGRFEFLNIYQKFELFVPLYRYHDRWQELTEEDISRRLNGLKGGSNYSRFLYNVADIDELSIVYDHNTRPIEQVHEDTLRDLCQYCIDNDIKVMFVSTPVCLENVEKRQNYNYIGEIIKEYGLYFRDFNFEYEEIGIDFYHDYYDRDHTNVYGSMKYTDYFSKILIEEQGFKDKRGQAGYESWDKAAEEYKAIVAEALAVNYLEDGQTFDPDHFELEDDVQAVFDAWEEEAEAEQPEEEPID